MVTMTINFKIDKLKEQGLTVSALLEPYDEHCIKHHISKPEINIFEKDGEHALASLGMIMYNIWKNDQILSLIDTWYWNIDGEYEDLLEGATEWKEKNKTKRS